MSPRRLVYRCVLAAATLSALAHPLAAQRRPTSQLMKRVAEACDGAFGEVVWIVAAFASPNAVARVFPDSAAAAAAVAGADSLALFPCVPPPPQVVGGIPVLPVFMTGCVHDGRSNMEGAFSVTERRRMCPPERIFPLRDVLDVSLVVRTRDSTHTVPLLREGADAVFFTLSAIDKFVMPYYTRILGTEATAAMRREIITNISRVR